MSISEAILCENVHYVDRKILLCSIRHEIWKIDKYILVDLSLPFRRGPLIQQPGDLITLMKFGSVKLYTEYHIYFSTKCKRT